MTVTERLPVNSKNCTSLSTGFALINRVVDRYQTQPASRLVALITSSCILSTLKPCEDNTLDEMTFRLEPVKGLPYFEELVKQIDASFVNSSIGLRSWRKRLPPSLHA